MLSFQDFGLKIGLFSCRSKYMKNFKYQRSRSFLQQLTSDSHIMKVLSISSKATGPFVTKFHLKPPRAEGIKRYLNDPGHLSKTKVVKIITLG